MSRPLAPARAMISRTCADVIQPCPSTLVHTNPSRKRSSNPTSFPGSLILPPGASEEGGKMRDPGNEVASNRRNQFKLKRWLRIWTCVNGKIVKTELFEKDDVTKNP